MQIFAVVRQSQGQGVPFSISTDLKVDGLALHDLGGGYRAYSVTIPYTQGKTAVVCARTGGVLGASLNSVRNALKEHRIKDTPTRIKCSLATRDAADPLAPLQFWNQVNESLKVDA